MSETQYLGENFMHFPTTGNCLASLILHCEAYSHTRKGSDLERTTLAEIFDDNKIKDIAKKAMKMMLYRTVFERHTPSRATK